MTSRPRTGRRTAPPRRARLVAAAGVLGVVGAAACGSPAPPSPRARALAQLPTDAAVIAAASGPALATPPVRAIIDALRPWWPARLGCAIDAALAGEQAALGVAADGAGTLAIVARAPAACPALSQVAPGVWVASIGAGRPPRAGEPPVARAPRFARARPSLEAAALVVAVELPLARIVASARTAPLEAWLVAETAPAMADGLARQLADLRARLARDPLTAPLAARVTLERAGAQVTARLPAGADAGVDLGAVTRALATALARPDAAPAAIACPAPPHPAPLVGCRGPSTLVVRSLAAALAPLAVDLRPEVAHAQVIGLVLGADAPALGLVAGDVLRGIDGRAVADAAAASARLGAATGTVTLTLERGALGATPTTATLTVIEQP